MITKDQISILARKFKINETAVFREYLQVLFLSRLYTTSKSSNIFFKGGTAIHLVYKAPRFSEDLDFTAMHTEKEFMSFIKDIFARLTKEENIDIKERKTITGKRFLLSTTPEVLGYRVFINLDFSFREKVFHPDKSLIETEYPVLFTSYLHHLSREEIFAEKVRAVMVRKKGRDLYDLWYLLTCGVKIDNSLINEKLKYYRLANIDKKKIVDRINQFSEDDFVLDLRPFVPLNERERLKDFFIYLKDYLASKL